MEEKGMFGGFDPTMMIDEALKTMRVSFDVAFDNMMKVQDFNLKLLQRKHTFRVDYINPSFEQGGGLWKRRLSSLTHG